MFSKNKIKYKINTKKKIFWRERERETKREMFLQVLLGDYWGWLFIGILGVIYWGYWGYQGYTEVAFIFVLKHVQISSRVNPQDASPKTELPGFSCVRGHGMVFWYNQGLSGVIRAIKREMSRAVT